MPITPLNLNLNATDPAAPTGHQNVVWGADGMNVSAYDPNFVGDSGAGGNAGNVPAPGSGDAAAGKFLRADGIWTAPPQGIGTWTTYTPTVAGSGSMTVASTSVSSAQYLTVGPITFFMLVFNTTLGGTAAGTITATIPITNAGANCPVSCSVGAPFQASFAFISGASTTINIYAPGGGNFTLGTAYVYIEGFFRNT